jgi:integral membrane protein
MNIRILRTAGIAEGVSFLVLLLIAMPLKYMFDKPEAVKIVGWLHGILFVGFVAIAAVYWLDKKKPFKWMVMAVLAALIPLGTFWFDRKLKNEQPV